MPRGLTYQVTGHVATLMLDRPERRNAVNQALAVQIDAAFSRAEGDPDVRVIVLHGGAEYFSAGTDLSEDESPATSSGGEYGFVRRARSLPLVAAVEGFALGGGFEMVLACDLVVAAENATFGLPEVKRGVVANCGAIFRAPEKLPYAVAMHMLLTGDSISARRGEQLGFVSSVTESGAALRGALSIAETISLNSPAAVGATVAAGSRARASREATLWPLTGAAGRQTDGIADKAEGIAAFFARREPVWVRPDTPYDFHSRR